MKFCRGCGVQKSVDQFFRCTEAADGLQYRCKECQTIARLLWEKRNKDRRTEYSRQWRAKNPERARANQRRHYHRAKDQGAWIKARYGLSLEQYAAMLSSQDGVCAICGRLPEGITRHTKLSVDHDHVTGAIRGLLCDLCNRGIGAFADRPERLIAAARYLERCGAPNRSPDCANGRDSVD